MVNDMYTMKRPYRTSHLRGIAIAAILAVVLVLVINSSYWATEPWPGGTPAHELQDERPWLKAGINELIRVYSLPVGLVIFFRSMGLLQQALM
jgi:hypothetical protein